MPEVWNDIDTCGLCGQGAHDGDCTIECPDCYENGPTGYVKSFNEGPECRTCNDTGRVPLSYSPEKLRDKYHWQDGFTMASERVPEVNGDEVRAEIRRRYYSRLSTKQF